MKWQLKSMRRFSALSVMALAVAALGTFSDSAEAIPVGWTCAGSCGTSGADGVVTLPPTPAGATTYDWISTATGGTVDNGASLGLGSETNGTLLTSSAFSADVGDALEFAFNYVTSDGSGFSDYAWARLLNVGDSSLTYLVTARTVTSGSIIPGTGMPAIAATLDPPSVPIIDGGPIWSPLGGSSGSCFADGCGYTGWVESDYEIVTAGTYKLQFGTVNWLDTLFNSGLAISGATIDGVEIETPEPATLAVLGLGLLGMGMRRRRA